MACDLHSEKREKKRELSSFHEKKYFRAQSVEILQFSTIYFLREINFHLIVSKVAILDSFFKY